MPDAHPVDVISDDLVRTLEATTARLQVIVRAGLARGLDPNRLANARPGDATLRYRERQLAQARELLRVARAHVGDQAPRIVAGAYQATIRLLDATVDVGEVAGTFGTIHVGALQALTQNMTASLQAAIDHAGDSVELVFQRADDIEGALLHGRSPAPVPFIGRRQNDAYRRHALDQVAQGIASLDTRRQVTENLVRALVRDGVTDAVTGFVDRAGRRWPLNVYGEMVARTTTREAVTRATVNRLLEADSPVVTVSSHPHTSDECDAYDGQTFALTERAAAQLGIDVLDVYPPFHPRCIHVLTPGEDNLDTFEQSLGQAVRTPAAPVAPPVTPPIGVPTPAVDALTAERLEAQRVADAIAADPGPDPAARAAHARAADRAGLAESRAIDRALGPDIAKELNRKWAKDGRLRADLLNGRRSLDDVREEVIEHVDDEWKTRYEREARRDAARGGDRFRCFNCSRFVAGKFAKCQSCGYDHNAPGSHPAAEGGLGEQTAARRRRLRAERRKGRKRWL